MFDKNIRNICINVYKKIKDYMIKGDDRKDFITQTFNIHINSLYNWIKDANNDNNNTNFIKYKNSKIDIVIETYIIHIFNDGVTNPKTIKTKIKNKFNLFLSYRDILCIFKINNLENNKIKQKKEIDKFIIESIKEKCTLNAYQLIRIVEKKFNKIFSISYIYKLFKDNKLTYKKTKIINNPHSIEKQKEQVGEVKKEFNKYKNKDTDKLTDIDNIVSIDEISICQLEQVTAGWSLKGEECLIELIANSRMLNERYSVLMAVKKCKILNYTIVEKGIRTNKFIQFMTKLRISDKKNKNIYFMDNASVHTTIKFKKLINELNLNVIYNAPYHSEFNPIEYVFSLLRKEIQKNTNRTREEIINTINNFIKNVNPEYLINIFNHSFKILDNFLQ
jgi:transposase